MRLRFSALRRRPAEKRWLRVAVQRRLICKDQRKTGEGWSLTQRLSTGCEQMFVATGEGWCDHGAAEMVLNPQGSSVLHPHVRENTGGCGSADHPELPIRPKESCAQEEPAWFRLCRLREGEGIRGSWRAIGAG